MRRHRRRPQTPDPDTSDQTVERVPDSHPQTVRHIVQTADSRPNSVQTPDSPPQTHCPDSRQSTELGTHARLHKLSQRLVWCGRARAVRPSQNGRRLHIHPTKTVRTTQTVSTQSLQTDQNTPDQSIPDRHSRQQAGILSRDSGRTQSITASSHITHGASLLASNRLDCTGAVACVVCQRQTRTTLHMASLCDKSVGCIQTKTGKKRWHVHGGYLLHTSDSACLGLAP